MAFLGAATGHLFFGNAIAEYIGWPKDDPFQFEVGLADFGMGILGIMCYWFDGYFWLASIVIITVFGWGCAIGHIKHIVKNKNFNPGNAGFVFWWAGCIDCSRNNLLHSLKQLMMPMIGIKILIDLSSCQLISNDIGSENQTDKLGERRHLAALVDI